MNMNTAFTSVIAKLGIPSRDGRSLWLEGAWTLLAPAPVIHFSTGTIVGEMLEMYENFNSELVVSGMTSPTIAKVLNEGTFKLEMGMDELIKLPTDPYAGIKHFTAGRVRGAHLVKAADWMWAL